jgi:hypothetical protein
MKALQYQAQLFVCLRFLLKLRRHQIVIRFDTTQVTNGTGKVSFDFSDFYKKGQAGFAVLDVEASKGADNGEGIIKIEEEKTTEETITIE